jgi:hypothetical protein
LTKRSTTLADRTARASAGIELRNARIRLRSSAFAPSTIPPAASVSEATA